MQTAGSGTRLIIDTGILAENYRSICRFLPEGTSVMAVLKADAYGLGAVPVARTLEKEGCRIFAVTHAEEAEALLRGGIRSEILVTSPTESGEVLRLLREWGGRLIFTVADLREADELSAAAEEAAQTAEDANAAGTMVRIHIKLDSGLGRLGLLIAGREVECLGDLRRICALPNLLAEGLYTHITAAAGEDGDRLNRRELDRFFRVADKLNAERRSSGQKPLLRHALSSFPILRYPEKTGEYARIGLLLFGTSGDNSEVCRAVPVKNCATYRTNILAVRTLPKGEAVSYGPLYTAESERRTAVVPVGFADGYPRTLSNRGYMLIRGQRAPVIGKVTCDYTVLDVTDIPDVKAGDPVVIFGAQTFGGRNGHYYPGEAAADAGMSTAEIMTLIHPRIPRIYRTE